MNELKKPCEYCGQDLPLGVDKPTRQVRSYHFFHCTARPDPEPEPEREWVGLTDEEIHSLPVFYEDRIIYQVVKLDEAKLKEKNFE